MAATENPILIKTIRATAALADARGVTRAGALPAAGATIAGVTRNAAAIGANVAITVMGTATVELGGTVAADALLEVTATGTFITKAAGIAVAKVWGPGGVITDRVEALMLPG